MFFDECMDSLDASGVESVSDVLNELARDRCVVVISHNPELTKALQPTQRWSVNNGSVRVD
jgi:DNA repair exonuclease SbcCD ATPase subunit